jgi:hypothetical protein
MMRVLQKKTKKQTITVLDDDDHRPKEFGAGKTGNQIEKVNL